MKLNFSHSKRLNMKSKINHLIALAVMLIALPVFAQKVESITYKGASSYVYPFKIPVRATESYYSSINLRIHKNTILKMLEETQWKDKNPEELAEAKKEFKKQIHRYRKIYRRNRRGTGHQLIKTIHQNPYPLLEQFYERDVDIKPCLDPIPDGTYIQYFEEFPLIDKDNKLTIIKDRVAGVFHIKNNMLEGEAVWYNFKGDILKKGSFKNGLKEGEWYFEKRQMENRLSKDTKDDYVKNGFPPMDTTVEIMTYNKGVRNGNYIQKGNTDLPVYEGHYLENEFAGHWIERVMKTPNNFFLVKNKRAELAKLRHNNVVTAEYTLAKDPKIVKQPLVRNGLIMERYVMGFDFNANYNPYNVSKDLYKIAFTEELDLELDEEKVNSYEGSVYDEEYYGENDYSMEEYEGEGDLYYEESYTDNINSKYSTYVYDKTNDKYLERGKVIDSIGIKFKYEGVYERRYPNGQLMFRYEFKDGKLLKEDTLFWDNGNPFDVITFMPDSNQYLQTVYDYEGKLYRELLFDKQGDFLRVKYEPVTKQYVTLEGLKAYDNPSAAYYSYDKMDTVSSVLAVDSILIWKSWFKEDSTKLYQRMYYPKERVLKMHNYTMNGTSSFQKEIQFGEDFKSWTGTEVFSFGNLTVKSHNSASYIEYLDRDPELFDSVPQINVNRYGKVFDVTSDDVLFKGEIPYSGPVSIQVNTKSENFKTTSEISLSFPVYTMAQKKLEKSYKKFRSKGKISHSEYLGSLERNELSYDFNNAIFYSLFPFLRGTIEYPVIYANFDDNGNPEKYKEKQYDPQAKKITGRMKDGKPDGVWTVEDQFGNIQSIIPYMNGEKNGTEKVYADAEPRKKISEEDYYLDGGMTDFDTFPKRKTHYLQWVDNYKNGVQHGESVRYNWLGEKEQYQYYVDGLKQGRSYERNNLAYTKMNYLDDALDGYVQTYLTIKGQDSILLFALNFQNGELQGESKSFHTNGKLSKRGFFLNGQPIDDYEAFDTLGFKYHYVKFLYSFPVEEKIWEENQLSVLYKFDWQDSINFTPSDITSSQSLDEMIVDLGLAGDMFDQPYYGRPSLVDKTGIDYHMTKYYPNDTIARDGEISSGKKVGCWNYYSYEGERLYEVDYFDSIIKINDSIQFKAKGILTDYNSKGKITSKSFIIEKFEKYDCSHTDHYEIRQLYTIWESNDSIHRMNGYVKNYYDNGVLQNEGKMENGLPTGVWKFYDPFGKLNQVGVYVMGKRNGRWLAGDLSKTKYLGDICLNPNLPDLEKEIKTREQQLDIIITNYKLGKALNKEFYDINWGQFDDDKPKTKKNDGE